MGFMDKVKQAAQDVSAEAKKATAQGKEKLGGVQTKRKMDDAAKRLGYLVYAEKTKGESKTAEIAAIVAEIGDYETELAAQDDAPDDAPDDAQDKGTPPPESPPAAG